MAAHPKVAVLLGPTAVGKTAVALDLARPLSAEIVNADSLQVYRGLDIGTAKPTPGERAAVPHHLLDLVDPDEPYDAARYSREGRECLAQLHRRRVPPLVVGGTGLYLKALLHGLAPEGAGAIAIKRELAAEAAALGLAPLYQRLARLDPATAARLGPRDHYRILRALEVTAAAGRPVSAIFAAHGFADSPYRVLKLGLNRPREELYRLIDTRAEAMLAGGWLKEVEGLLTRYPSDLKPLKSLGYRHLVGVLEGRWGLEEALTLIQRDTRRYAKRQLTWFRADPEVKWFEPGQVAEMLILLQEFFGA